MTARPLAATAALVLAGALAGCRPAAPPRPAPTAAAALAPGEGMLRVPGGRVWYRVVGTGRGTPVLAIHGGPGGTSCRLRNLARLAGDRPVIFYDQLGTGRSERPTDTTLWTLPRFVAEVDSIRAQLGLREVVLFGHSWGGTVAAEYALTRPAAGVRALVLAGPLLSTPRWLADADTLVATLPAAAREAIATADRTGRYDAPAFAAAVDSFNARYNQRDQTARYRECDGVTGSDAVYRYMWGPSEFRSTGTLRDYDRTARLGELRLPVLLVGGEHDEARPATLRAFQQRIPGAELVIVPGAAHRMLVDAPERSTDAVRDFLARRGVP
jgi:proline iminopeptidase